MKIYRYGHMMYFLPEKEPFQFWCEKFMIENALDVSNKSNSEFAREVYENAFGDDDDE